MDKQFLEFWGNVLLAAAKGQQQLDDLAPWIKGAGPDSHEWGNLFRKIYGLGPDPADPAAWNQAMRLFQSSLKEWMALFDMVPRGELAALQKKNRELEERVARQEATIELLRQRLDEKGIPSPNTVLDFSRLMQKQSQQFQDLMKSMGAGFKKDEDTTTPG